MAIFSWRILGVFECKRKYVSDFPLYHQEDGKTYADLDIDLVLLTEDNEKIYCKATGVFNYILLYDFREYRYLNDVMGKISRFI